MRRRRHRQRDDRRGAELTFDVLIVGAGHAGASVAIHLRQAGFTGSIAILGDEPELPYERPPLSKDYLAGKKGREDFRFRSAEFWAERDIRLIAGERVTTVHPSSVHCAAGRELHFGQLVWAAGGRARRLPGAYAIRTLADVDALKASLPGATRILVVGGGWIGLEAAAVLATAGKQVVLAESQNHLLARCSAALLSDFLLAQHRGHGVDVRLACGQLDPVRFDLTVAGIGIEPNVEPLLAAGADGNDGVLVDEFGRTSLPNVWAAGDCALHRNRFGPDRPVRIESVQNAADMGACVARAIAGDPQPYAALPWFWSNQYDLKLQTVGLSHDHDEVLVRGDPAIGKFAVIYRRAGRVIALDCVNNTRDYVQGRALIERGVRLDGALLTDADRPLKSLLET
ncbi:FAD-dependent oxidoreductase [Sphingomonas sp. BN140010]|uniref:FAD-dependent oxidoreductase n=1 Tax=Sphingomonas arvum TaxID=2992113 RepID=A0ABT3JD96_9SPHN|nr:FAD-dependent oxidoreductase [Sphingomonas sp. BN140010]MCW3796766.1 FAD-dependent oxidoreductase [Sphingomonas sp. BN140010]